MLIGRTKEKQLLVDALHEEYSQFIAVYGRRRVGKTFLIREAYDYTFDFQFTGAAKLTARKQLVRFRRALKVRALVVDELCWIAVVQVVAWIALVLANRGIVQYKVVEDAAIEIRHETADLEQEVFAKAELQSLFVIVLHQFVEKLLVLLLEADFAGANVEPLDVVLSKEGIDDGSCAPCLTTCFADEELGLLHGANSKGFFLFTIIAVTRGDGESSKHHKGDSPKFHSFHIYYIS